METSVHASKKSKLHIYPFSGEWYVINDMEGAPQHGSFTCPNEALDFARNLIKGLKQEYEIVIHSRHDSMPHFRMTA